MATGRPKASRPIFESEKSLAGHPDSALAWEYVPIRENKYLSTAAALATWPLALGPPVFGGIAVGVCSRRRRGNDAADQAVGALADPAFDRQDSEVIWRHAGNPDERHPVDVLRTIDGDTFEARVHLSPGLDMTTRVRLRGIDAPELKAACPQELRMAKAATGAYNIGADKYQGRVVADAATKRTDNVSAALVAAGHVRSYSGGHRGGWCATAGR